MKKIAVIAFFFLTAWTVQSQAQNYFRNLKMGIHLSPSFNWIESQNNKINSVKSKVGLHTGVIGEWYFKEHYAITSGIGFAFGTGGTLQHELGGKYWRLSNLGDAYNEMPPEVKLRYRIQYLEIPLGLKLKTTQVGYLSYFVEPGLVFNFRTQAKGKIIGAGLPSATEIFYIKKEVNGIALAYRIGAGGNYQINQQMSFLFGLYFQKSFTDVTNNTGIVFDSSRGWPDLEPLENAIDSQNSLIFRLGILF
jgi:hypothetical protein